MLSEDSDVIERQPIIASQRRRKTVAGLMTPTTEDMQVLEEVSVALLLAITHSDLTSYLPMML